VFVQHNFVMPPESVFEFLHISAHTLDVFILSEDREQQNEYRIIW
jgi:hypothetical protein